MPPLLPRSSYALEPGSALPSTATWGRRGDAGIAIPVRLDLNMTSHVRGFRRACSFGRLILCSADATRAECRQRLLQRDTAADRRLGQGEISVPWVHELKVSAAVPTCVVVVLLGVLKTPPLVLKICRLTVSPA